MKTDQRGIGSFLQNLSNLKLLIIAIVAILGFHQCTSAIQTATPQFVESYCATADIAINGNQSSPTLYAEPALVTDADILIGGGQTAPRPSEELSPEFSIPIGGGSQNGSEIRPHHSSGNNAAV